MTLRYLAASVAITGIVVVTVWLTDLSFQRAILLAPVLVIGVAAAAGMVVFWGRVGWESLRRHTHPWRVVTLALSVLAVLAALSMLGLKLPHE